MHKRYRSLAALLTLFTILAGCSPAKPAAPAPASGSSGASSASQAPIQITWLQWWTGEWGQENMNKIISGFEAANPGIKVKLADAGYNDMVPKLNAAASAGDSSYDVVGIENSWVPNMVKQGYVQDMTPWLSANPSFRSSLAPATEISMSGKTYALSLYQMPFALVYDVDAFAKASLKPPTSWNEFRDDAAKLRDKKGNKYGIALPLADGGTIITRVFGPRLAQLGGQLIDAHGKVVFNSPAGVEAVKWWKDFFDADLAVPGAATMSDLQAQEMLGSGQVAMNINGPFVLTNARQINPNAKLAYAPAWKDKTGGYVWDGSGVSISSKSKHQAEAEKFVQYLYSDAVSVPMTKAISLPFASKAAMASLSSSTDPILKEIPAMSSQDPAANIGMLALPEPTKLYDAFKVAFQDAISGKKDIKVALDEAAAVWQTELDKAK